MTKTAYFASDVLVDKENKEKLIKAFNNNMFIYNYFLDLYEKNSNKDWSKKQFSKALRDFLRTNRLENVIANAAFNEVYYLSRKIARGEFIEKRLNNIKYLTLTNNALEIDFETRKCRIKKPEIEFYIVSDLKEEEYIRRKYINLSYSVIKDKIEFKLFD